jgi:epoxyqueuosine reductase
MKEERLVQELSLRLEKEGYQSRTVSVRYVRDLQESMERNHAQGLLNEEFYQERLTHFSFKLPETLPDAQSLIVVAAPQPQIRVVFTWQGEPRPVVIPPTYVHETDKIVESILSNVLDLEKHHFTRAALPLKLLAVRSGLGDYGRNNICYVPGFGSFHRLVAYCGTYPARM